MSQTETARSAKSLEALLAMMNDEVYEALDGSYSSLPTWGPETAEVARRIGASCAEGDIVSWDTRQEPHRYLMRQWTPAQRPEHRFSIEIGEPMTRYELRTESDAAYGEGHTLGNTEEAPSKHDAEALAETSLGDEMSSPPFGAAMGWRADGYVVLAYVADR